jgi:DNA-binding response OmpR family regulator
MSYASRKILIVDDDLTALDIINLLFEDAGFEVDACTNGWAALSQLDSFRPDIILIDLMMPQISGQDLIRFIRDRPWQGPIIAFTALDDPITHSEALNAGCSAVLTKPCKAGELVEQVQRLIPA